MRKLLIVVVIVLVAILAGWITYTRTPDGATFTIETEKMADDTKEAIDSSKDLLQKGADATARTVRDASDP